MPERHRGSPSANPIRCANFAVLRVGDTRLTIGCGHPAKWIRTWVDGFGVTHRDAVCGSCARPRLHPERLAATTTYERLDDWLDGKSAVDEATRILGGGQPDEG